MKLADLLPQTTPILIVDDVKTHRLTLRLTLEDLGYQDITEAANGDEALRIATGERTFGLVISDWEMPVMEGIDLCRRLAALPQYAAVPFVMATARGELEYLAEATFEGVWGYVVKPYSAETLHQELLDVLEHPENL